MTGFFSFSDKRGNKKSSYFAGEVLALIGGTPFDADAGGAPEHSIVVVHPYKNWFERDWARQKGTVIVRFSGVGRSQNNHCSHFNDAVGRALVLELTRPGDGLTPEEWRIVVSLAQKAQRIAAGRTDAEAIWREIADTPDMAKWFRLPPVIDRDFVVGLLILCRIYVLARLLSGEVPLRGSPSVLSPVYAVWKESVSRSCRDFHESMRALNLVDECFQIDFSWLETCLSRGSETWMRTLSEIRGFLDADVWKAALLASRRKTGDLRKVMEKTDFSASMETFLTSSENGGRDAAVLNMAFELAKYA